MNTLIPIHVVQYEDQEQLLSDSVKDHATVSVLIEEKEEKFPEG